MKTLLQNKFEIVFSLLILTLPFSKAIPNLIFAVLFLMFLIEFNKQELKKISVPLIIVNGLLIFLIVKSLVFGFILEDYSYYRFFLIIIIISILFIKVKNFLFIKKALLIAVNLSLLFSIYKIALYYLNYHYMPFNDGWAVNRILIQERPYAGFFSLICIIISFDLMSKAGSYKVLYFLSILISTFFLFIISARISILSLFLIGVIYFIFFFQKRIRFKALLIISITMILASAIFFNENLSKRFFLKDNLQTSYAIAKDSEPRVVIWSCAKKMILSPDFNNFIGNASYNETYSKLTNLYDTSIDNVQKRRWFLNQQYNTHNQFIDFYLIGGILGFSIFILFIAISFYCSKNNFFAISIMISLTLFLMVENMLQRQFGVFIFILTYCLYFFEIKEGIKRKIKVTDEED